MTCLETNVRCIITRTSTNNTQAHPRGCYFTLRIIDASTNHVLVDVQMGEAAFADMLTATHSGETGLARIVNDSNYVQAVKDLCEEQRAHEETKKTLVTLQESIVALMEKYVKEST